MSKENNASGSRTMLLSVLMSAPGPLILGLGLMAGRSSTQIADFVRRSAELLGIIMAFVVYRITTKEGVCDEGRKAKLERCSNAFVGAMMCLGGSLMVLLTFFSGSEDKGNVVPAMCISAMGMAANFAFWLKYTRLDRKEPNAILRVQARLYRAKALVDTCVTAALLAVLVLPGSAMSYWLDLAGSLTVAVYLAWCGVRTVIEAVKEK